MVLSPHLSGLGGGGADSMHHRGITVFRTVEASLPLRNSSKGVARVQLLINNAAMV